MTLYDITTNTILENFPIVFNRGLLKATYNKEEFHETPCLRKHKVNKLKGRRDFHMNWIDNYISEPELMIANYYHHQKAQKQSSTGKVLGPTSSSQPIKYVILESDFTVTSHTCLIHNGH